MNPAAWAFFLPNPRAGAVLRERIVFGKRRWPGENRREVSPSKELPRKLPSEVITRQIPKNVGYAAPCWINFLLLPAPRGHGLELTPWRRANSLPFFCVPRRKASRTLRPQPGLSTQQPGTACQLPRRSKQKTTNLRLGPARTVPLLVQPGTVR